MSHNIIRKSILKYSDTAFISAEDSLSTEEPLEILLYAQKNGEPFSKPVSITMRTPGHDTYLAAGFLLTEGIIESFTDIDYIRQSNENTVNVKLNDNYKTDLSKLDRHFYTNSSCGVCGKGSIENLKCFQPGLKITNDTKVSIHSLLSLNNKVKEAQSAFNFTGGIHASALFNSEGNLLDVFEDVGRHNALDKLIGKYFLANKLPFNNHLLFLSGRSSFELIQKAAIAGFPIVAALGAPSSLAVEVAEELGITLIGFLKEKTFNVYTHPNRIENVSLNP
jgi:FdhD protein